MAHLLRCLKTSVLMVKNTRKCDLSLLRRMCNQIKLVEVGLFEEPKQSGTYESGQLFLHRIFGYRAAVSFPWMARVYDRDEYKKSGKLHDNVENREIITKVRRLNNSLRPTLEPSITTPAREMKPEHMPYYQVLIDERDCPYVRVQTEAVSFLRNNNPNRSFYAIPGLDYASHDDIIPYGSSDAQPIQHILFNQFLMHTNRKAPPFEASALLKEWRVKNQAWLGLSEVHRETTEGVRVTVIPFYVGCRETAGQSVYWWRYCVRLENLGEMAVQLRERHWRIFSLSGTLQTVRGRGVIGQEPILCPRLPAFQYCSHINLHVPSGQMWGTLRFEREDGHTFDCKVPPFSLDSQPEEGSKMKPCMPNTFSRSSRPKSEK